MGDQSGGQQVMRVRRVSGEPWAGGGRVTGGGQRVVGWWQVGGGQAGVWQAMGGTLQIVLKLPNLSKTIQDLRNRGVSDSGCSVQAEFSLVWITPNPN